MVFDDITKIGIGLTGFGVFFMTLGVLFLFDKGLLAMGNLLFLAGVTTIIGFRSTWNFFFQMRKLRGSATFFGGIFLVLIGWTLIGMVVELYGFFHLFGDFFPTVFGVLKNVPVIGTVLRLPIFKALMDRVSSKLPV